MNKAKVLALGVPEENYKAFQEEYSKDIRRCAKSELAKDADPLTRSAILAMLQLIRRPETLDSILKYINKAYFAEGFVHED